MVSGEGYGKYFGFSEPAHSFGGAKQTGVVTFQTEWAATVWYQRI